MSDNIFPGDPIEVATITEDGTIWNRLTVVRVQHDRIIVADAVGDRRAIPNNPNRYRLPRSIQPAPIESQPVSGKVTREGGVQ